MTLIFGVDNFLKVCANWFMYKRTEEENTWVSFVAFHILFRIAL